MKSVNLEKDNLELRNRVVELNFRILDLESLIHKFQATQLTQLKEELEKEKLEQEKLEQDSKSKKGKKDKKSKKDE